VTEAGVNERRKRLVRRFYEEAWNRGEFEVVDELFARDYVRHDLRPGQPASGPSGMKDIAATFRDAFPDIHFTVEFVVAGDGHVVARWTATGTHTGAWAGVPATGRSATFSGVNIYRFDGEKAVELWNHRDDLGLAEQLGAPVYAGMAEQ
jgi:steroid delta-isomerase-like uncharacterized protein